MGIVNFNSEGREEFKEETKVQNSNEEAKVQNNSL